MAVDMFLKIDAVTGESSDSKHKGEIDVLSWSWGMTQSASMHTATGGGSGKADVHDVSITKYIDSATPAIMQHCCSGKHFQNAKLTVRKAGGNPVEYMVLEMKDVIISSLSSGAGSGDDRVTEHLTLNFASYKMTYTPQDDKGAAKAAIPQSFDIRQNVVQ
jgi:type VI secretion system secreted protein Hcp